MEVIEMGMSSEVNKRDQGSSDHDHHEYDQRDGVFNYWTNERHLDFLTSMEATFVRNMLQTHNTTTTTNSSIDAAHHHHHRRCHRRLVHSLQNLRLDRYVPDISESTLDLQTTKKPSRPVAVRASDLVSRRHRERPPTHPYQISTDQVVPQAEDKAGDKDEGEGEQGEGEGEGEGGEQGEGEGEGEGESEEGEGEGERASPQQLQEITSPQQLQEITV